MWPPLQRRCREGVVFNPSGSGARAGTDHEGACRPPAPGCSPEGSLPKGRDAEGGSARQPRARFLERAKADLRCASS